MSMGHNVRTLSPHQEPPGNPICLIDGDGTIQLVNSAFEQLTKFPEQELLEVQWGDVGLVHEDGSKLIVEDSAASGARWQGELTLKRKTGEEFRAYAVTAPLTDDDDRSLGVILSLSEVSHSDQSNGGVSPDRYRQVTHTISDLLRNLVQATDQETAIRLTCMKLATSDVYSAAWFGEFGAATSQVRATEIAGMERSHLSQLETNAARESSLAQRAIDSQQVLAERDILSRASDQSEKEAALARGYQSRAIVPVVKDGSVCGVIGVFSSNPDAFTADEREILKDLGVILGHIQKSVQQQSLLHSDTVLELEFIVRGKESVFVQISREFDCTIQVASIIKHSAEWYLTYLTVESATPETVKQRLERSADIGMVRLIDSDDQRAMLEVKVKDCPLTILREHGGVIADVEVTSGTATIVGEVLPTVDIHQLLGAMQRVNSNVELTKKRERNRSINSVNDTESPLRESLTDRQREVLEVAYHAGYFSSPRHSDGQHLAESLGISSAAFYELVRRSIRNILGYHFEEGMAEAPSKSTDSE